MTNAFHNVLFPLSIALKSTGGPSRRTDILPLQSGHEQRIARWQHSRRRYNAGVGIKNRTDLLKVIDFFEARRGRFFAFRFPDMVDYASSLAGATPTAFDQQLSADANDASRFALVKNYGDGAWRYQRPITKPRENSVQIALNGQALPSSDYSVDYTTGIITFVTAPQSGDSITAGFEFDVPVRFDSDELMIDLVSFEAGHIPNIPIIEVLG